MLISQAMRTLALALALTLAMGSLSFGATINGTVVFDGRPPTLPSLKMSGDAKCEAAHAESPSTEILVLGEGQTVANIFVEIKSGLPERDYLVPAEPVVVTQAGCVFNPHVFGVRAGQPIEFQNPDGTLHNINARARVNRGFNLSMPGFRKTTTREFAKAEPMFSISCDVHAWMTSWCAVVDHPFFDVTAKDGKFSIEGLEAGTYEIEAWHERMGAQTATITLEAGETKTHDFAFSRSSKR